MLRNDFYVWQELKESQKSIKENKSKERGLNSKSCIKKTYRMEKSSLISKWEIEKCYELSVQANLRRSNEGLATLKSNKNVAV